MLRSEKWTRDKACSFSCKSVLRKIGWWGCPGVLAVLVGSPLFAQDEPIHQGPPLKVSVNRVSVGVTVSDAGEIMPPKSTWFEPKLRDGLLSHEI